MKMSVTIINNTSFHCFIRHLRISYKALIHFYFYCFHILGSIIYAGISQFIYIVLVRLIVWIMPMKNDKKCDSVLKRLRCDKNCDRTSLIKSLFDIHDS